MRDYPAWAAGRMERGELTVAVRIDLIEHRRCVHLREVLPPKLDGFLLCDGVVPVDVYLLKEILPACSPDLTAGEVTAERLAAEGSTAESVQYNSEGGAMAC
jgi:hypothetical protein